MLHDENTTLAGALYDLYMKLVTFGFLGDVYLSDNDVINVRETDVCNYDIPIDGLTSEKIDEICIGYQMLNPSPSVKVPYCVITESGARKIITDRFDERDILHWHMCLVDLSTQERYLTHYSKEDYEPGCWKVWYVERRHGHQVDENDEPIESIATDNFYLVLPARKVHIIF